MNTNLVIILSLILIVGLILFWLFFRKSNNTQKLSEKFLLEALAGQDLTPEQRTDKEQQLSNLLQKKNQPQSKLILILVAVIIVPSSLILYKAYGNPEAINYVNNNTQPNQTGQQAQQAPAPQMSMQEAVKQLEDRLAQNPDDVDGQMLYARSQISMKAYGKAVKAYRKANELAPNEPVILTELAESIALFNNNRSFLGEPETLLQQAVALDDTNQKALWLYGMIFYEKKDFVKTNELWTKLYGLLDNDNAKAQLQQQLNDVQSKLGITPIVDPDSTSQVADQDNNSENSFNLNVNISYNSDALPPLEVKRATLYLYTKATSGMPMPIAVIQKPLNVMTNAFPMKLSLSDLNNLQPTRKLSEFDSVVIGARISFTGNATASAGDLQTTELKIDLPYTETVELVIDKVKE